MAENLLKNDNIVIEAPELRLYSLFCRECGKPGMTEDEAMSEMFCDNCGCKTVRVLRDKGMEKLLLMKGTVQ